MAVLRKALEATGDMPQVPPIFRVAHFRRLREIVAWAAVDVGSAIDNDLLSAGWAQSASSESGVRSKSSLLAATPLGRTALVEYTARCRAAKRPHEDLADAVVQHYDDRFLGFRAPNINGAYPDVFLVKFTRNPANWLPTSIEVKANRADARRDLAAGKWRKYAAFSERVYFAGPRDVIGAIDVPVEVGLLTVENGNVVCLRAARRNRGAQFDAKAVMGLVFHQAAKSRDLQALASGEKE